MLSQIEVTDVAAFILDVCDFSEDYEDDSFTVDMEGARYYVERKANWFVLHVGDEQFRLPRFRH